MQKIELGYGAGTVSVQFPRGADVTTVMPNGAPPLADFEKRFLEALDSPIESPSLAELARQCKSDPVAIIANDSTRLANSDKFLPPLLDYLNRAGVSDDRIFITIACGSHRPMTDAEIREMLGDAVVDRVECVNHVATAKEDLIYFGETSRGTPVYLNTRVAQAGLRILTGSVVHHFFAGFGGGRKALIPGVAGHETIQANHSMMLLSEARIGVLDKNPVAEDLLEAARMVGGGFLVNVVLNEAHEFAGVFVGDTHQAHLKACELVEAMNGVRLPFTADLVVASCGGFPKDINAYQAQKTLDNAAGAVKPDGHIVLLAECGDGVGSDTYLEWARKHKTLSELEAALKANFVLGGHKAYAVARLQAKARVHLVSALGTELEAELGFIHADTAQQAVDRVLAELGPEAKILVMPEGSITVPMTE